MSPIWAILLFIALALLGFAVIWNITAMTGVDNPIDTSRATAKSTRASLGTTEKSILNLIQGQQCFAVHCHKTIC
jgi:hypothetical protein